jgi:hypothetical protein
LSDLRVTKNVRQLPILPEDLEPEPCPVVIGRPLEDPKPKPPPVPQRESWVVFEVPGQWKLTIRHRDQKERKPISWQFSDIKFSEGGSLGWQHGRLIAIDASARSFYKLVVGTGRLTFGAIEAELRELTGYKDEQPDACL